MERYLYRVDVCYYDEIDGCEKQVSCFVSHCLYLEALSEVINYFGDNTITSISCRCIDQSVLVVNPSLADLIEEQL